MKGKSKEERRKGERCDCEKEDTGKGRIENRKRERQERRKIEKIEKKGWIETGKSRINKGERTKRKLTD